MNIKIDRRKFLSSRENPIKFQSVPDVLYEKKKKKMLNMK